MSLRFQSTNSPKSSGSADRGSSINSANFSGSKFSLPINYGGLGYMFYVQLSSELDKVLQVDTMNKITETKGSVKIRGTRLAIEMQAKGVGKNDIILISSKTHANQTIVLLATLFLGAIVCPIYPESPFKECLELVKKLKPKMCFCDSRTVSQISRILVTLNITSEIVSFGDEDTGTTQFSKLFPFKEDTDFKPFFIENPHMEVAFIIPTQGTCNDPKLVCLSHHNIYSQCYNFMELLESPTKVLSFFPLSWVTQTVLVCASLAYGVTRIIPISFNERMACKMIHDFVIDVVLLGTDLAMRLTGNVAVKDFNLNCLKSILVGTCNTSKNDLAQMRKTLPGVKFLEVYSLTETGFVAAVSSSNYSLALEMLSAVGRVLKNCKIKIVDLETRQTLGPDQVGELYFHGDGLMLGYFKDTPGTKASIDKGYFKTGDLAKFNEDGWVFLKGRIDDMIQYADSMFIPTKLESCIACHPQVHDAAVIGNQTNLIACIERKTDSKLTKDSIMMFIFKNMPDFDFPISDILFFNEFPRTPAGNIKKKILREQYLQVTLEYTHSLASIESTKEVSK